MRLTLPDKKKVVKWTLGFLGAVFIGALGSGVWQSLLGPAIHISSRWVLDLGSLGVASYKNGVYQLVAADDPSWIAIETLHRALAVWMLIVVLTLLYYFRLDSTLRSRADDLAELLSDAPPRPKPEKTADTLRQDVVGLQRRSRKARTGLWVLTVFVTFTLVNDFEMVVRRAYVTSADAHYHQVLRLASPYLDAHGQAEVESDFAQVSSREDYVRVLSRLQSICKTHGRTVPAFDPW